MAWTERQREMLGAMGLRVWAPLASAAAEPLPKAPVPKPHASAAPPDLKRRVGSLPSSATLQPAREPAPLLELGLGSERERAVSGMAWPELRAAVQGCTACGLSQTRQHTVFGAGHESAHWMIVGEAPGEQEDESGEPFVGAAGQLLDHMLKALNLTRDPASPERQVFIANTLKCRPPRNRNPEAAELASCAPLLKRQIELIRPRVLLAMGRFAVLQTLGSEEAIGRLRGRVHQANGIPVVVTFHPSYLLRQPREKGKAWEDLCLAASVAGFARPA